MNDETSPGARLGGGLGGLVRVIAFVLAVTACDGGTQGGSEADGGGSFTALGSLAGYASSEAAAVSADGRYVAGTSTSSAGFKQAVRWTARQGAVGLGFLPGGTFSSAAGVSAEGGVVVGDADGGDTPALRAVRWTAATGLVAVDALPGATICTASGVSADGVHIAGTCSAIASEAFRWSESAGVRGLGRFGTGSNASSRGAAISSDGGVIGGAGHPVLMGAILWDVEGSPTVLGNPAGESGAVVTSLSSNGQVAAGSAVDDAGALRAFRWSHATGMVALPCAENHGATRATGLSGDARRIVGSMTRDEGEVAILWEGTGCGRPLIDLLSREARIAAHGWKLERARAISTDGRTIVGHGTNPAGAREAWMITLAAAVATVERDQSND
jgi:uncharacterized membrane protein